MLLRQDSPSARTDCVRQSNDFTDLGTLEANLWFIGRRPDLRAFPIGVGWRLATARAKSLPDWKRQIDPDQHPVALHPRPIQIARDTPYATHGAEADAYK
jgi:hypothetical protein